MPNKSLYALNLIKKYWWKYFTLRTVHAVFFFLNQSSTLLFSLPSNCAYSDVLDNIKMDHTEIMRAVLDLGGGGGQESDQ
jgi:hypothetical protein